MAKRIDIASKLLTARHSNLHIILGAQHPHLLPPQIFGNCDCLMSFALQDEKDTRQISQTLNLTKDQHEYLSILPRGSFVCSFPRSEVKHAFILQAKFIESVNEPLHVPTASFISDLPWEPLHDELAVTATEKGEHLAKGLDAKAIAVLTDVLNEAFLASTTKDRRERLAIASTSKWQSIVKTLITNNYIITFPLQVSSLGKPSLRLYPTDKAIREYNASFKKPNGTPKTHVATELIGQALKEQGEVFLEGKHEGVAYDLLVRTGDDRLIGVEIANTTGDKEFEHALHSVNSEDIDRHIVVCLSKETLKKVECSFSERGLLMNQKIEVMLLCDALKVRM